MTDDSAEQVHVLLGNFRLLEAAGACALIAPSEVDDRGVAKPPEWWEALADTARTYHSAIRSSIAQGTSTLEDWAQNPGSTRDDDLLRERARLGAEHRKWIHEVPAGQAYEAWLSAYVAIAELDGEHALKALDRCAAVAREFADVPELGRESSIYEFLQSAANALGLFLPLPEHPVRDVRRFAFLPSSLWTGYGS